MITKSEFLTFLEMHPGVVVQLMQSIIDSSKEDNDLIPDLMAMVGNKTTPQVIEKQHPKAVSALVTILAPYLLEMMQ